MQTSVALEVTDLQLGNGSAIFQSGSEKRPHHHRTQVVIRHTISQRFFNQASNNGDRWPRLTQQISQDRVRQRLSNPIGAAKPDIIGL